MDSVLAMGKQILSMQPFSVLLGAELTSLGIGQVELCIPITPQLLQQHGFVHGGVISYAADNALTFAGGSVLGPAILTSEFKINYLQPARQGKLIARATVVHASKNQAVCRCEIFVGDDTEQKLCAVAQGTIVRTSGRKEETS
jgi:uncharacterized protein (TIGR00369 family)